jgi:hypothetical protein
MFSTHLLFSSPRLRFSRPQKQAILQWAKDLGAPNVPALGALASEQRKVEMRVGHPTEKVTSPSGNVFYFNDVGKAIARVCYLTGVDTQANAVLQDYANPLTRFAMRDYPQDDGSRMSQVHNGQKMLLDLPQDVTTPTVRVNGRIYFVGEILQRTSGAYFIPERFFTRNTGRDPGQREELFSLGRKVVRSTVGGCNCLRRSWLIFSTGGVCCS